MPNHITTEVEISGPKDKITQLVMDSGFNFDENSENQFDFNAVVKMPEELLNTVSPTRVFETQEEVDAENKRHEEVWKNKQVQAITKKEADRRQKEYGALNWYDWSNVNWGTKWNAYEVRYIAHDDEKIVLKLDTAWDTPRAIWDKLEEQGFTVKGVMYGEMEGYEFINDGESVFEAYQTVETEYIG